MPQKGLATILILVGILIIALIAGGAYYLGRQTTHLPQTQNPLVTSTPQPSSTPEKFTQDFYDQYILCLNTPNTNATDCIYQMKDKISGDLSVNLPTEVLRGHLLCGAQSPPQKITVDKATVTDDKASITVHTIYQYSGDIPLNIELKSTNRQWKITNISCPSAH